MSEAKKQKLDLWLIISFVLMLFVGIALIVSGIMREDYTTLGLGVLSVIIPSAIFPVLVRGGDQTELKEKLDEVNLLMRSVNERLLLSDQAKRLAYREKDREMLRQAIMDDIQNEQYDAALVLVEEMANSYGYREEAEKFRQQILDAQSKHQDAVIDEEIAKIDAYCNEYQWERAKREIDRITRLYAEHPKVRPLENKVAQARERHKRELEREFLRAAEIDDVEKAIELLTELDRYLTPEEAEPYRETARGVIGKKRMNLGVQFKLAIHDRDWLTAVQIGDQIIRDFPNSKMADEVRSMRDVLRDYAQGQRAAEPKQTDESA